MTLIPGVSGGGGGGVGGGGLLDQYLGKDLKP